MKIKSNHKVRNQIALLAAGLIISATTQAALVGHWTFDETSGTSAADSTLNGYDGVVNNANWTAGIVGDGALHFNGDADVSGFGTDLFSTVTTELTIAFWCFGESSSTSKNPFSGRTGTTLLLNSHLPHSGQVYFDVYAADGRNRINSAVDADLHQGAWNHWAFTRNSDNGTQRVYVNGELILDETAPGAQGTFFEVAPVIEEFFIGTRAYSKLDNYYKGILDDFRVYDNELSLTEISNLYAAVSLDYVVAVANASEISGNIPASVTFNATNTVVVGEASIVSYAWDFGDGTPVESEAVVSHTYPDIGTYDVTLTVTDDQGKESKAFLQFEAKPVPPVVLDWTVDSGATYEDVVAYSANDLAQTAYESSSGVQGSDGSSRVHIDHARFFDGLLGEDSVEDDDDLVVHWGLGGSVTVVFDTSVNTLGYDITNIVTIAGWKIGSNGRSNQGYEVMVTDVNGVETVIAPSTHWAPNNPAQYWTRVNLFEENQGIMASGVKSVTFTLTFPARAGGRILAREIDIFGVPSKAADPDVPIIAYTNNNSSLTWNSNGDFLYSVQSNLNLAIDSGWGTFTNVVGTIPQTTIDLPAKAQNAEFYRVIIE